MSIARNGDSIIVTEEGHPLNGWELKAVDVGEKETKALTPYDMEITLLNAQYEVKTDSEDRKGVIDTGVRVDDVGIEINLYISPIERDDATKKPFYTATRKGDRVTYLDDLNNKRHTTIDKVEVVNDIDLAGMVADLSLLVDKMRDERVKR